MKLVFYWDLVGLMPVHSVGQEHTPVPSPLTERETRIAVLVAEALTNREVAKRLGISESTAKTHVSAIITKLGCSDRVGIVIWAFRNGLKH